MKRMKLACILGNGPSLRGFDFPRMLNGYVTFGMNAAYRYWEQIGWYPNYYACLDVNLGLSHRRSIARLIANSDKNNIRSFFLREEVVNELGDVGKHPKIVTLEKLFKKYPCVLRTLWLTTGSHTALWAILMGFNALILLGIDCNYVEKLPESRVINADKMVISKTPNHNPNYFFDGYQQEGDIYSVPNPRLDRGKEDQINSWHNIYGEIKSLNALVVNANMNSRLTLFEKVPFANAKCWLKSEYKKLYSKSSDFKHIQSTSYDKKKIQMDEVRILYPFLPKKNGYLLAIGDDGFISRRFLDRGWRVWIGQCDPFHRKNLKDLSQRQYDKLTVIERAFRETSDFERPWFVSLVDSRLNGMQKLDKSFIQNGTVNDITVVDCVNSWNIPQVDLMTIQTNGFELHVLSKALTTDFRPHHLIIEYNNQLLMTLGHAAIDIVMLLEKYGYSVYFSKWKSRKLLQKTYWEGFYSLASDIHSKNSNGNIVAFRIKPRTEYLEACVNWAAKASLGQRPPLPKLNL